MDMSKIAALAEKAVATGADQTVAQTGGGDYTPPPEGTCNLRFVGYIEIGKQETNYKGIKGSKAKVLLVFELSGKNYPANENGEPIRLTIEENYSLNDKANFYKLLTRMNYNGAAKHMAQLLGGAYRGRVVHDKWTGKDGKERVTAQLRDDNGYTIGPPRFEAFDPDTGDSLGIKNVEVAPAKSELRCFLWDHADTEQWQGLFIEGEYPERKDKEGNVTAKAKSKNVLQNRIKLALNFKDSPMYAILLAGGKPIDIPDAESGREPGQEGREEFEDVPGGEPAKTVPTGAAADDALSGVV